MLSNPQFHFGQPNLPFLLVWLIVIVAMFFGFRAVNRITRQKLPWLHSTRMTYVSLLLTVAAITLMVIFLPRPKLVQSNQDASQTRPLRNSN